MIWFYRRKQENLISFSLLPAAFSASRLFADICKYIIIFLFNPPDYTQICDIAPNCFVHAHLHLQSAPNNHPRSKQSLFIETHTVIRKFHKCDDNYYMSI